MVYRVTPAGVINIVAGTGVSDLGGDGGVALNAQLDGPRSVRLDDSGNLYIADRRNHRIRKVDVAGIITTIAGRSWFGGDGGPATQALLAAAEDTAVDSQGNVYIADTQNQRIRKVAPDGTISTYAGSGGEGDGGDGGPATDAEVGWPRRLAIDSQDNLYIATYSSIRRVRPDGIIEAFAAGGDHSAADGGLAINTDFGRIQGIAAGPDDSIYVTDSRESRVRRIAPDGFIYAFAGTGEDGYSGDDGPATAAQFEYPLGVAADAQGNVFITDSGNARIRKVDVAGIVTTVAGNGQSGIPVDGQLATAQPIVDALDVAVEQDGSVLVSGWTVVLKIHAIRGSHLPYRWPEQQRFLG